jgi:hypothetical protein
VLEVAAYRLGDRLSAIELLRGQPSLEVVQTATKTRIGGKIEAEENEKTPENKSVDWGHLIPNPRESALDKIEMESSRRGIVKPRLNPGTAARILDKKGLETDRSKRRMSALDEIELVNPNRGAVKQKKERTLQF